MEYGTLNRNYKSDQYFVIKTTLSRKVHALVLTISNIKKPSKNVFVY